MRQENVKQQQKVGGTTPYGNKMKAPSCKPKTKTKTK